MSAGSFPYGQALATAALVVTVAPAGPAHAQILNVGTDRTAWHQVGDWLRSSGLGLTVLPPEKLSARPVREHLTRVSQSLLVGELEFAARFAGLPLDDYRRRMPPAVYEAYIRFVGLVPGDSRLDVVEAADLSEG